MSNVADIVRESVASHEAIGKQFHRLITSANADRVFRDPVVQGEYTVVVAAELTTIVGFGFGAGGGGSDGELPTAAEAGEVKAENGAGATVPSGGGGGGGGGGTVSARPVAAIEVGPRGVRVEPIIDPTKIALAFFTTLGAVLMFLSRMKKQANEWDS